MHCGRGEKNRPDNKFCIQAKSFVGKCFSTGEGRVSARKSNFRGISRAVSAFLYECLIDHR